MGKYRKLKAAMNELIFYAGICHILSNINQNNIFKNMIIIGSMSMWKHILKTKEHKLDTFCIHDIHCG